LRERRGAPPPRPSESLRQLHRPAERWAAIGLADLEVDEPNDGDLTRAEERLGKAVERPSVFVLKSQGRHYLVVAAAAKAVESNMDIFDCPFR